MTERDLLHALQNTDSSFILETEQRAAEAAQKKTRRIKPILLAAAGIAACLGLAFFAVRGRMDHKDLLVASNDPTEQITEAAVLESTATEATDETESGTTATTKDTALAVTSGTTQSAKSGSNTNPTTSKPIIKYTTYIPTRGTASATTASKRESEATATRVTDHDEPTYCVYAHVTAVNGNNLLILPDSGQRISSYGEMSISASYLPEGTQLNEGMWIAIYCDGLIQETHPAQFNRIIAVDVLNVNMPDTPTVQVNPDDVYVWRDLIQENITPTDAMGEDNEMRIALTAYPDTQFIWRHYGIYYERNHREVRILGSDTMNFSNTITPWQVFFTDLTGDGYPEICINYCMGSDYYCTQNVYIYDYLNDEAYGFIGTRGETDYVLRSINNRLYAEAFPYSAHPVLKFNEMTGTLGTIVIPHPGTWGELEFVPNE